MPTEGAALELLLPEATFSICKLRLASVVSLATAIVICTREIFSPQTTVHPILYNHLIVSFDLSQSLVLGGASQLTWEMDLGFCGVPPVGLLGM